MPAPKPIFHRQEPLSVFQVIRHREVFGKADRASLDVRDLMRWDLRSPVVCNPHDGICPIPAEVLQSVEWRQIQNLVCISDVASKLTISPELRWVVPGSVPFLDNFRTLKRHSPVLVPPFQIVMGEVCEIHLRYDRTTIGEPSRADFKLADLQRGETVEVRINGKLDNSMSSGRARTYMEQAFLITWLGNFTQFEAILNDTGMEIIQTPTPDKRVDLRKPLW